MTDPTRVRRAIPVACTLDSSQVDGRLDQWHQTLTSLVTGAERPQPRQLRLALSDDPARIAQVLFLARAEKTCCSFFTFTLDIDADTFTLVVEVPAGSESVLDDFARLAGPRPA